VQAQQSSLKSRWISLKNKESLRDSLTIDPASLLILKPANVQVKAVFEPNGNIISFFPDSLSPDSIFVSYRLFPFNLSQKVFNRDLRVYDTSKYYIDPMRRSRQFYEGKEELFATPGLNKTGTISRGISFGNNQDVFVNSALNLQMEGKLSQDVSILAAISDQNIPIQPEGNTQNLQQFDRVYIQLSGKGATLTAGDVVLRNKESHFLRYLKNVQGGLAEVQYNPINNITATTSLGVAVSKGKFNSLFLEPVEGLQGPYKLRGPNNERFIVVISGSEKVYLDGRLLTRGFNYDYIIDYNQAEITFMNQVLVTKFSRIRVDFEYTDRNYARTTLVGSHYQSFKKLNGYFNFYSEKDNPNTPITAQLSPDDIEILKKIGDTMSVALAPGAVATTFSSNQVLYKRVDTALSATPIYVYTPSNPGTTVYQLTFSDLGQGNGNYVQVTSAANGKVYEWRAPKNGVPQGRFEPVRQLPVPNKKQLYNAGIDYAVSKNERIYAEYALSEHSQNLFSRVNSNDDVGSAIKVGYANKGKDIGWKDYRLMGALDYEYLDKYFRPIDRFRSIEFDRDWGTSQYNNWSTALSQNAEDHLFNASMGFSKDKNNELNYRFSHRQKEGFVNGQQHQANIAKRLGLYQLRADYFFLKNDLPKTRSDWQRFSFDNSLVFKHISPGYRYSFDRNSISGGAKKDSVIASAMYFEEHNFYVKSVDSTKKWRYATDYSLRKDNAPLRGEIVNQILAEAKTWNNSLGFKPNENNNFNLLLTYRNLENKRDTTSGRVQETIMGRLDWISDLFKRHIRSELTYTAQTGRQQVNEYVYVEVPAGQGLYKWVDYNNDNVKQLNEFVEAVNFDEKIYLRYNSPTDRFVKAYTNNVNYRINLTAPRNWREKKWLKRFASRFSNTTAWTADRKTLDESLMARFLPLYHNILSSDLLSNTNNVRSTLFFNRASPSYGLDLVYINTNQRNFLFNGIDTRQNLEYQLNSRLNVRSLFNLRLNLIQSTRGVGSDYLLNRNYTILKRELNPEIAFQPTEMFRLIGSFQFIPKENIHPANKGERADFKNLGLEARLNQVNKRTFTANVKYINIFFLNGDVNSPLGYDMLESLRPGNNFTWQVNMQQKLTNGLNISLNYEGRKAQNQAKVHIGRVQVSAVF
jgi:hypothetical protein